MSSNQARDERRLSTNLSVTSKCLAIVFARDGKGSDENTESIHSTVAGAHNGKELLEDFKLRNKTCYWNPALVESIKNLGYKGFVEPSTVLVGGNEIHLENLRTAWGRRVLKSPAGFTIERIGDVSGIEMQVIPQTQFIPLPDALCLIIMDLNNRRIVATLDTIKEKLFQWYREMMMMPSDQLIFETLGGLIQERKVFHSGSGYFVVTPETYRMPSDNTNMSFNTSWLPYHPMYIPVFPQIHGVPQHLQHFHLQQQQDLQHRATLMSCQENMHGKKTAATSAATPSVRHRPRSHSVRGVKGTEKKEEREREKEKERERERKKEKEKEKEKEKASPTVDPETTDNLKRTMSIRCKADTVKAISKDVNLKTSNINQDKEKGEKEKVSLFSKIFGRNKKKNLTPLATVKEVEYATFSAQFPPPEWHWYQQQVERQRRTENWVSQQVGKPCTLQSRPCHDCPHHRPGTAHPPTPPDNVLQENNVNVSERKGNAHRHGKSKREKTAANEQRCKENQQMLYVRTNEDVNLPPSSLSPVIPVDEDIYQSVLDNKVSGPMHSTPCYYDTIPVRKEVREFLENNINHRNSMEPIPCNPHHHHHRRSHRHKRRSHRSSIGYYDIPNQTDISFEYKGKMPSKNSVCAQSRDSGVNCIGLTAGGQNNEHQDNQTPSTAAQDPITVRNRLDNLEEEVGNGYQEHGHLNNTLASDYQTEINSPPMFYDSSMNEDNGGVHIVCEAEINHRPVSEAVLDAEPCLERSCSDSAEPAVSTCGSRDALSSEKSYDTVVDVKKIAYASNKSKNPEGVVSDTRDVSLVDSGFSSPRNQDGGPEPVRQNKNSSESHKQYQPQAPRTMPPEQQCVEHLRPSSTLTLNNQRHTRMCKYDADHKTAKDLEEFEQLQQQMSAKRFGLNGEFEVVGVV